jgi:hypothetical protein
MDISVVLDFKPDYFIEIGIIKIKRKEFIMKQKITFKSLGLVILTGLFSIMICTSVMAQEGKLSKLKSLANKKSSSSSSNSNEQKDANVTVGSNITQVAGSSPEANKAFTDNKDNIDSCRKYMEEFINERVTDDAIVLANNIPDVIKLAEKVISDINTKIPDLDQFQKDNEEARNYHLKSKLGFLQTDIDKSKERFADLKPYLLKEIKGKVEWLAMPEANCTYAPIAIEKMNANYALLDKFFPNDPDVEASKKTDIPEAKRLSDKLLKDVAKNRMAVSKYTGGDKATLEKKMAEAYTNRYSTDVVKRVVITDAGWTKKNELIDDNTKTYWRTSSYIGANVAVQREGKTCTVYVVTFRKDLSSGQIELYSAGSSFPVLNENVTK